MSIYFICEIVPELIHCFDQHLKVLPTTDIMAAVRLVLLVVTSVFLHATHASHSHHSHGKHVISNNEGN